jgi:prenyl protein peptidase
VFERCHFKKVEQRTAVIYCFSLALAYVGSLYLLVPSRIRRLDRSDHVQIQYRCIALMVVCLGAIGSYPFIFCDAAESLADDNPALFFFDRVIRQPNRIPGVLLHTIVLYIGPIMASLLRVYEIRKRSLLQGRAQGSYPAEVVRRMVTPTIHSFLTPDSRDEFWNNIRNLVVAPWTEEIIFRGCMVPPLLAAGMSPPQASLVAPLFFGIAHVHHAAVRVSKGEGLPAVVLVTVFQFLYTSLFGSYASYAFIRTGSVVAVTACHAYCNWMGLPDLSFVQIHHPMYKYRIVLLASYLAGVFAFKWFFTNDWLLPLPPELKTTTLMTIAT